jgi:hypothetical protein
VKAEEEAEGATLKCDDGNGPPARAAVLDMAPRGSLDQPTKRVLRRTTAVGAEGTSRKVSRRVGAIAEAVAMLDPEARVLAQDAGRDWVTCGLLADAVLEILADLDVGGPMFRRLFDAWLRLQALKGERRAELAPVLLKAREQGNWPFPRSVSRG